MRLHMCLKWPHLIGSHFTTPYANKHVQKFCLQRPNERLLTGGRQKCTSQAHSARKYLYTKVLNWFFVLFTALLNKGRSGGSLHSQVVVLHHNIPMTFSQWCCPLKGSLTDHFVDRLKGKGKTFLFAYMTTLFLRCSLEVRREHDLSKDLIHIVLITS